MGRAFIRLRAWSWKISAVTPPPWRQRIRGRERSVGLGGVFVIVGVGVGVLPRRPSVCGFDRRWKMLVGSFDMSGSLVVVVSVLGELAVVS